jgi:hypothetical protein
MQKNKHVLISSDAFSDQSKLKVFSLPFNCSRLLEDKHRAGFRTAAVHDQSSRLAIRRLSSGLATQVVQKDSEDCGSHFQRKLHQMQYK